MSNAETGFFRPMPLADGSLLVLRYTGNGFIPATIEPKPLEDLSAVTFLGAQVAEKYPVVKGWQVAPPSSVDLKSRVVSEGKYNSVGNIRLESVYPVVEGYKDSIALGASARFSDPIRLDRLRFSASYSVDDNLSSDEKAHLMARWEHRYLYAELDYNKADFYDLFGPTKTSRKGYSAELGLNRSLIYDLPRELEFKADVAYHTNLDALPAFQNVPVTYDKLFTAGAELNYSNVRSSIGAVDEETGYKWSLFGHLYNALSDWFPGAFGKLDFGHGLPLGHSSVWLRNAAGISWGDRDSPLANAYFGAFGNNYVDDGEAKRYRDVLRMPGFDIDQIQAQSFVKSMLEWNLPPVRFEGAGTRAVHATWVRPALFSAVLVADPDNGDYRHTYYDVGAQVDFEIKVQQRLPMMLSFGYAVGFDDNGRSNGEFMASLKIL
jgi:hypothetical protein